MLDNQNQSEVKASEISYQTTDDKNKETTSNNILKQTLNKEEKPIQEVLEDDKFDQKVGLKQDFEATQKNLDDQESSKNLKPIPKDTSFLENNQTSPKVPEQTSQTPSDLQKASPLLNKTQAKKSSELDLSFDPKQCQNLKEDIIASHKVIRLYQARSYENAEIYSQLERLKLSFSKLLGEYQKVFQYGEILKERCDEYVKKYKALHDEFTSYLGPDDPLKQIEESESKITSLQATNDGLTDEVNETRVAMAKFVDLEAQIVKLKKDIKTKEQKITKFEEVLSRKVEHLKTKDEDYEANVKCEAETTQVNEELEFSQNKRAELSEKLTSLESDYSILKEFINDRSSNNKLKLGLLGKISDSKSPMYSAMKKVIELEVLVRESNVIRSLIREIKAKNKTISADLTTKDLRLNHAREELEIFCNGLSKAIPIQENPDFILIKKKNQTLKDRVAELSSQLADPNIIEQVLILKEKLEAVEKSNLDLHHNLEESSKALHEKKAAIEINRIFSLEAKKQIESFPQLQKEAEIHKSKLSSLEELNSQLTRKVAAYNIKNNQLKLNTENSGLAQQSSSSSAKTRILIEQFKKENLKLENEINLRTSNSAFKTNVSTPSELANLKFDNKKLLTKYQQLRQHLKRKSSTSNNDGLTQLIKENQTLKESNLKLLKVKEILQDNLTGNLVIVKDLKIKLANQKNYPIRSPASSDSLELNLSYGDSDQEASQSRLELNHSNIPSFREALIKTPSKRPSEPKADEEYPSSKAKLSTLKDKGAHKKKTIKDFCL